MNLVVISLIMCSLFIYLILQSILLLLIPRRFRRKKDLRGQKVLITGAGSGLGRQLAVELSRSSTCLVLLDIDRKALEETQEMLDPSSSAFVYECDIADRWKVYKVSDAIQRDAGSIDILINNAGIVHGQNLLDLSDEQIIRTIEVNTLAHFWTCKAFVPSMMERNQGHIVCVSSVAGLVGGPKLTDYSASKFAAVGFAEALEMELKVKNLDGVKVTVVCPSHINTGLFDGMNITFSSPLTVEYVAKEIVHGIQTDSEVIILPSHLNVLVLMKQIFPHWFVHKFYELTGNFSMMENFKGRACKDKVSKDAMK